MHGLLRGSLYDPDCFRRIVLPGSENLHHILIKQMEKERPGGGAGKHDQYVQSHVADIGDARHDLAEIVTEQFHKDPVDQIDFQRQSAQDPQQFVPDPDLHHAEEQEADIGK